MKYTLLMDSADADSLDHLILRLRRTTGRRLTRSQLIRGLLTLAPTDTTLVDQVLDGLGKPYDCYT